MLKQHGVHLLHKVNGGRRPCQIYFFPLLLRLRWLIRIGLSALRLLIRIGLSALLLLLLLLLLSALLLLQHELLALGGRQTC